MNFRITERPASNGIFEGMIIRYRISPVMKIPLTWITRIEQVTHGVTFTDTQMMGPYKTWRHVHSFAEDGRGVHMQDEVTYELPLGFLGTLAHAAFVRRQLEHIFNYREAAVRSIFKTHENTIH